MSASQPLEAIKSLPPIPQAAHDILRLLSDPDVPVSELAKAISREPSVTARIVAMGNSAFFMTQRPVYTVDDAIVRLGLKRVKVLTNAIILSSRFDTSRCGAFRPEIYWYHAIRSAFGASRLVAYVPVETPSDAAYLGGLLHNFGMLLMAYAFPMEMNQALQQFAEHPESSLSELEAAELGFDHHVAGGMLLQEWALPAEIVAVAQYAHRPDYEGAYTRYVKLIGATSGWVSAEFEGIPDLPALKNVAERTLNAIAINCKNESEQLKQFAESMKTKG
jgi:HD-like signal output (HDOD) protein